MGKCKSKSAEQGRGSGLDSLRRRVAELEAELSRQSDGLRSASVVFPVLEQAPHLYALYDLDLRILWANKAYAEAFGRSREELCGVRHDEIWHGGVGPGVDCPLVKVKSTGKSAETEVATSDGRSWVVHAYPVLGELEKIVGLAASFRPATERRQEEKSEEHGLFLDDFTGIAYQMEIDTFKPVFFHGMIEEMTGYGVREFVDGEMKWDGIIHPEDQPFLREEREKLKAFPGHIADSRYRIFHKEGGTRWVRDICRRVGTGSKSRGLIQGTIVDITQPKKAEQALKESEERYRRLAEDMPAMICSFLPDSTLTYVNSAIIGWFGMSAGEMVGKRFLDLLIDEEERERERNHCLSLTVEQPVKTHEMRWAAADGTEKWVQWTTRGFFDERGHARAFQSFGLDITYRKMAEKTLREAHGRLNDIIEFLPDATFVVDLNGKVIAWNRAIEEMTGVPKSEIIGKGDYAYAIPFYNHKRPILIDLVLQPQGEIEEKEYELLQRRGHTVFSEAYAPYTYCGKGAHLWGTASMLRDEIGEPYGAIESIRDITERKQAEKALARRTELQQLLMHLATGFVNVPLDELDQAIIDALGSIGRFCNADRAFLISYDFQAGVGSITHEWCEDGIPADWESFQNIPIQPFSEVLKAHLRGDPVYVPRTRDLPDGGFLREILESYGIRTLITLPLMNEKECLGCIGFDSVRKEKVWEDVDVLLLKVLAELLTNAEVRRRTEAALRESESKQRFLAEQNRLLSRISISLAEAETEKEIMRIIAESFKHLNNAVAASMAKYDPKTKELVPVCFSIDSELQEEIGNIFGHSLFPFRFPVDLSLKQILISQGILRTHSFEELSWGAIDKNTSDLLKARFGIEQIVAIALHCRDELVGTTVAYLSGARLPLPDEVLKTFGYMSGLALSRKRAEEERIEMERRVLHGQKLESLGVLAGGIAHDFNNLLAAMLGNLDLALLDLPPTLPARKFIENSMKATRHAAELTRQMLAYSGRGRFALSRLSLSGLLEENVHMLKVVMSKSVSLQVKPAKNLPDILADPGQIQQVIMNLLTNASEAIGEKSGIVSVSTGAAYCDDVVLGESLIDEKPPAGRFAYIEVADTGCGMSPDTLQRLFDPFFTTKFVGRGLGMSAVQGIVRGHHGAILVRSEVDRGTTIMILFPVCKDPAVPGPPGPRVSDAEDAADVTLSGTILVVDDEEMVVTLCKAMLERMGFRVLTAVDGEDAVRVFRERVDKISCVLLDLTMPNMDGEAAMHELRRIREDVKIILSSGYDEQEISRRFTGNAPAGFIQKPYLFGKLRYELERVLKVGIAELP